MFVLYIRGGRSSPAVFLTQPRCVHTKSSIMHKHWFSSRLYDFSMTGWCLLTSLQQRPAVWQTSLNVWKVTSSHSEGSCRNSMVSIQNRVQLNKYHSGILQTGHFQQTGTQWELKCWRSACHMLQVRLSHSGRRWSNTPVRQSSLQRLTAVWEEKKIDASHTLSYNAHTHYSQFISVCVRVTVD